MVHSSNCRYLGQKFTMQIYLDYVKIATVMEGARNILVEEVAPSENTIAVSDADGKHFYLNGDK